MTKESNCVTMATRLEVYGLQDRETNRTDLRLSPNETFVLTAEEEDLHPHLVRLRPESAYDLKRWLGVPNDARRAASSTRTDLAHAETGSSLPCEIFTPRPPLDRSEPELQTNLHNFLFGDTRQVTADYVHILDRYIGRADITISIFAFNDIYVARHARLVVDKKIQVLFARHITVERTGLIDMQAPFSKIDCAGFSTTPLGSTSTTAVTTGIIHTSP